jgi:formate-dependent nitrite reductase membrane component NrfD
MTGVPSSTWFTVSPEWGWLIMLYFFFGGLAGGCYFLAALIDLFGRAEDRPLARLGYYTVMPCVMACGVLLLVDLSRPERFWHLFVETHTMLPMFKPWSPMSVGSWALPTFGVFALLSFLGALSEAGHLSWQAPRRLRPPRLPGKFVAVVGALLGLFVAGYTGVLLAVTNRPIWADTPLLGMLLLVSATSISAALMFFLAQRARLMSRGVGALQRIGFWVIVLELVVLIAVIISLGPVARAWLNAWGLLLLLGVGLSVGTVPLALGSRKDRPSGVATSVAPLCVIAGGLILRSVIVFSSEGISL